MPTDFQSKRGSILIFAVWVLTVIALFSIAIGFGARERLEMVGRLADREELRYIAEAGIKKATYILSHKNESEGSRDALSDEWSTSVDQLKKVPLGNGQSSVDYKSDDAIYYGMRDEESKININTTNSSEIIGRIFELAAGLGHDSALALAESLLDWRDPDEEPHARGAESDYYKALPFPYRAKNADFSVLDELIFVKGMTPEIYDKIIPYITLDSSGKVNLNTASNLVLRILGMSDTLAYKVVSFREGPDRLGRTKDDRAFQDLSTSVEDLNLVNQLDDNEHNKLTNLIQSGALTVNSSYFTIQSTGRFYHRRASLIITCVADRSGVFKRWFEKFQVEPK